MQPTRSMPACSVQAQRAASHAQAGCSPHCYSQRPPSARRGVCRASRDSSWQHAGLISGVALLLGSCLLSPAVQAASGGDPTAHWHPVAADINNLAQGENEQVGLPAQLSLLPALHRQLTLPWPAVQFWKNFVQVRHAVPHC